jgi:hypothetical protein
MWLEAPAWRCAEELQKGLELTALAGCREFLMEVAAGIEA